MGVLDDAIREHLELKRRHGATEDDLRRQEEEALGPARREVAPEQTEEPAAAVEAAEPAEEPVSYEPPSEELELDEPVAEHEEEAHAAVPYDDEDGQLAEATPPSGFEAVEDEDGHLELEEEELLEEESDEDADVLEDTPDFLQETPEHDRLWFEQKPPRDFDFDS
jgi:hypothetical protein